MIEQVKIVNFKSHTDSDITFNQGLNIFIGEVGAGKTSILESISFALFGRYVSNIPMRDVIRRGNDQSNVSLVFSKDLDRYRVERTIFSEKTQRAKLWLHDGKEWRFTGVQGAKAVSKSIEDILDVDSTTFLAAIYASQGEIKEMLETQPGRRRERLDKLLGIDMYENLWKTLLNTSNIIQTKLIEVQDIVSGVDVLQNQIKDLESRKKISENEFETRKKYSIEIGEKLKPTLIELEDLEEIKQELAQLETRIDGKRGEIENSYASLKSLGERIDRTEEAERIYKKYKSFIKLENKLKDKKNQIEKSLQQKKYFKTLINRDGVELKETEGRKIRVETQLKRLDIIKRNFITLEKEKVLLSILNKEESELTGKLGQYKLNVIKTLTEIKNQNRKVEDVKDLNKCPTCLQIVPDEHKEKIMEETTIIMEELENNYQILQKQERKTQESLDLLKKRIEEVKVAERKYNETSIEIRMLTESTAEISDLVKKIKTLKSRIEENENKFSEINETQETLNQVINKLNEVSPLALQAQESEKHMASKKDLRETSFFEEKKVKILESQLTELNSKRDDLSKGYDQKKHAELKNAKSFLEEEYAKNIEAQERLKKGIEEYNAQIDQTKEKLVEKKDAKKRSESLRLENKVIQTLRDSIRDIIQPIKRRNNVFKVSEAFQNFFQELSIDSIDYAAIDEEGNIKVVRNGEPSPINSLSGGETTCAALALRLAICSSLTNNQLLLLDEPTIHLDELHRSMLREFLSSHSFEQLIVVTHDNTFDSLPAQSFRVEKKKGGSIISPIIHRGT